MSQQQLDNALSKAEDWVLLDKQPEQQEATELLWIREISYYHNAYDHGIYIVIEWRMMTIEMNIFLCSQNLLSEICITKLVAAQKAHTRKNVSVKMNDDCDSLLSGFNVFVYYKYIYLFIS